MGGRSDDIAGYEIWRNHNPVSRACTSPSDNRSKGKNADISLVRLTERTLAEGPKRLA